jgi:hypothetical protein
VKKYIALLVLISIYSCKSKQVLLTETKPEKDLTADKIIESANLVKNDFSTLYIKSSASYKDENQSQNVSAEIKIKKNEKILISIRLLGITMAKALITPTEVKYYEKINGNYFDGDFKALSQWLGTDLDFQKIQNMLLGQSFDPLKKGNYKVTLEDNLYKLSATESTATNKVFYFENERFLIKKQQLIQDAQERMLQVSYPNHKEYNQLVMPLSIFIEAIQKKGKTSININYNSISINEELSFPYSVPESYERVFIN